MMQQLSPDANKAEVRDKVIEIVEWIRAQEGKPELSSTVAGKALASQLKPEIAEWSNVERPKEKAKWHWHVSPTGIRSESMLLNRENQTRLAKNLTAEELVEAEADLGEPVIKKYDPVPEAE